MRNLAPKLVRQRVIVEAIPREWIQPPQMKEFLLGLARVTKMEVLSGPHIYPALNMGCGAGYGSWTHWKTSGSTFYSYREFPPDLPHPLITLDCYTCKPFDPATVEGYVIDFFDPIEWDWMEVTR